MKRRILALAAPIVAAAAFIAPASANATVYHAGCASGLAPGFTEYCAYNGWFRYFELSGTGNFYITGPNNRVAYAHYNSYQNWSAFVDLGSYQYGRPRVANIGCCGENYWAGYVW